MELKKLLQANWDRAVAAALVLLGVVALALGWWGVSGTGVAAEQNPYLISGGLLGIALIGIGCTLWLSADLQDEWRRLDSAEERLAELEPRRPMRDELPGGSRRGRASEGLRGELVGPPTES